MKCLTIAANKGGVGKTTLSSLLAVRASQHYDKIFLIDLDPQQSLKSWWSKRAKDNISLIDVDYLNVSEALSRLKSQSGFLIIDTPPAHIKIIQEAIRIADYILIPCRPSPLDVEAIGETITLVEQYKKPFCFVSNSSIAGTQIGEQALMLLSKYGQIAPSPIRQRVIYATSMINGQTAIEMNNKQAKDEIHMLWEFINSEIGNTENE